MLARFQATEDGFFFQPEIVALGQQYQVMAADIDAMLRGKVGCHQTIIQ